MLRNKTDAAPTPVEMDTTAPANTHLIPDLMGASCVVQEAGVGGTVGGTRGRGESPRTRGVAGLLEELEGKQDLEEAEPGAEVLVEGRRGPTGASEALCKEPDLYSTAREATGSL